MASEVDLKLEFLAGAELLVGKQRQHAMKLNSEKNSIRDLLQWICDNILSTKQPNLFMQGDTVRPGILVLVNDVDWELTGGLDTALKSNDTVTFISTLHGG